MTDLAATSKYQNWNPDLAQRTVQEFADKPGALIVALHKLQEIFGYVDEAAIMLLAKTFNLSRAEVHGVTSFYHDFRHHKPGHYTIKVCQAEACQAMGSEELTAGIKAHLGIDFHETTPTGEFSLEPVYCLGNCACCPNIMIDDQVHARMSVERFKTLTRSLVEEANR
ncbi:MAG: formate dehydrogenase subunit gamma [Pseudomonadales bacterium]|nr:formate dehydrogenase subunit gamma [Pseudomonadales bacterium]